MIDAPARRAGTAGTRPALEALDQWIEAAPVGAGAHEARLLGSRIPVWALISYLRAARGDVGTVARDYRVPRQAVEAALAYYRQHQLLIDLRITLTAERWHFR